ncbi:hypothetical protein Scep_017420 [Stephania cephalantha]|uniref:Uncharacterized protein n=1 Tax=Stephania cephalantha TaxID=152367 RepID=A0AAP0IRC7_9MAGN
MAEKMMKRLRDETTSAEHEQELMKRHKSFNQIISLLDEDEEEPNQDLSSFITTLQQELFSEQLCSSSNPLHEEPDLHSPNAIEITLMSNEGSEDGHQSDMERIMRHLVEASDDELGIDPCHENRVCEDDQSDLGSVNGGGSGQFSLEMWEIEDETANFYTLLQSEMFQ